MRLQHAFVRLRCIRVLALCAIAAAMTLYATGAIGAEIKVLASANTSLRSALTELASRFEGATGHKVSMRFAAALPLKRLVDAGEAFDVVIAPAMVDALVEQGKVAADTRATLVRTGLGVGVTRGAPKPDIGSVDALKRTLLGATAIGYEPESQPGMLFLATLDRLGIAQDVRPRLKVYSVEALAAALDKRDVEMAVSSITNLATMSDVVAFPPEAQTYLDFAIAVSATAKEPEAARALLRFLLSPPAIAVLEAKGFTRE